MPDYQIERTQIGGLHCITLDLLPADTLPQMAVIICHGYGAPGEDLVPIGAELLNRFPELASTCRFFFPAAPISLDSMGLFGGRAWWHIDMERLTHSIETGELRDQSDDYPEGLLESREKLLSLIADLPGQTGNANLKQVLGGFSQGSMLATEVALSLDSSPAALAIFSGTLLCQDRWREMAEKSGSLRVLQSHGTQDPILPYQAAVWLKEMWEQVGADIEFISFTGVHTIPGEAISSFGKLLIDVSATSNH